MKLIKLKLAHFQSYNREIEIDFLDFNQTLFLITGATGSGKTTLFDAICYALYGSLSSEDKHNDEIKSRFSNNEKLCYVELQFEVRHKLYTIKRIPSQISLGKMNKPIKIASSVFLSKYNISKSDEVNKTIQQLIGLNLEQFRQIILLPQGKFQKLLLSSSDEKEKIFRSLFKSEPILNIQLKIKNKLTLVTQKMNEIQAVIESNLDDSLKTVSLNLALEQIRQIINLNQNNILITKEKIKYITNNIKLYETQNKLQNELILKQKKLNGLDKKTYLNHLLQTTTYEKFIPFFPLRKKIEEITLSITSLTTEYNQYTSKYQTLLDKKQILNNDKINILKLEKQFNHNIKQLEQYNQLILKYNQLDALKLKVTQITNNLNNIEFIDEQQPTNKLNDLKQNLKYIQTLQNELNEYLKQKTKLVSLETINNYFETLDTYQQLLKQFYLISDQQNKELSNLNNIKKQYYANLAFIVSKQLQPNIPCPVCGSTKHPKIATKNVNISNEDVEQSQMKFDLINNEYIAIQTKLEELNIVLQKHNKDEIIFHKKKHAEIETKINEINKVLNIHSTIYNDIRVLEENLEIIKNRNLINKNLETQYQTQLNTCLTQIKELNLTLSKDEILNEINLLNKFNETYSTNKFTIEQNILSNTVNIEHTTYHLNKIEEDLNQLNTLLTTLKNQYNQDTKDLIKPEIDDHTYLIYKEEITRYETQKQNYINEIKVIQENIIDISTLNLEALQNEYQLLEEQLKNYHIEYATNIKRLKNLNTLNETYQILNEDLKQYTELYEVLNGHPQKNNNISFERFLLAYYLEQVIILANERLSNMSDNRYYFIRRLDYKGKGKKGLELDIFDNFNGSNRSVSSLSGGEIFQASLAFALGLSDYLTQLSNKNTFEFLFIDEGFGTLDLESLDIAVNTLQEISSQGKTIGVISHIEELKNRIPNQIIIEKTKNGSKININK